MTYYTINSITQLNSFFINSKFKKTSTSIFNKKVSRSSGFRQVAVTSNSPVKRKPTSPLDFDGAVSLNSKVVVSLYFSPLPNCQPLVAPATAATITHTFQYMINNITMTMRILLNPVFEEKNHSTRQRVTI